MNITKDNIIQIINNLAAKIANEYIDNGISPEITITSLIADSKIDNEEILSRICEKANQNIYISIFNSTESRGDIKFPLSKKEDFIHYFKKVDPVYSTTPKDYKEYCFTIKTASPKKTIYDKLDAINDVINMRNKLAHFVKKVESMCYDENNIQQKCVQEFEKIANELIQSNQSIVDYAKLSDKVIENTTDLNPFLFNEKIASIADSISKRSISVNTKLTKLAFLTPNPNNEIYKTPVKYINSLAKVAALSEIGLAVLNRINILDLVLNNENTN